MKLTLSKKLFIGFFLLAAFTVELAIIGYRGLSEIDDKTSRVSAMATHLEAAGTLKYQVGEALGVEEFYSQSDSDKKKRFDLMSQQIDALLQNMKEIDLETDELQIFGQIKTHFEVLKLKREALASWGGVVLEGATEPHGIVIEQELKEAALIVVNAADILHILIREKLKGAQLEAARINKTTVRNSMILCGLAIILGITIVLLIRRSIQRPLQRLTQAAARIGKRDFNQKVEVSTQDELGDLADAFNTMGQALQETTVSKKYVDNILRSMVNSLIVTDASGRIQTFNEATLLMLDYQEEDLRGQNVAHIFSEGRSIEVTFGKLMNDGFIRNVEETYRTKTGQKIPVFFSGALMHGDGGIEGIVLVAQDLTELKQAEEALRQGKVVMEELNKKLQENQSQLIASEKLASLGQLSAGVAHEINNPIGFVLSNLETLGEYVGTFKNLMSQYEALVQALQHKDSAARTKIMDNIRQIKEQDDFNYALEDVDTLLVESQYGAKRVQEFVQNLKKYARRDNADMREADINAGIEMTLKIVWNQLKYKCEIHKQYGELPAVLCYPGELNQVFMNLLVNAAQAVPEHGDITIETKAHNSHVTVKISDTGDGIPPENLSKLFSPFFTTKPEGEGTGLGLSISQHIIQKHQGTIDVESEVGRGTTFAVRLPVEGPELD